MGVRAASECQESPRPRPRASPPGEEDALHHVEVLHEHIPLGLGAQVAHGVADAQLDGPLQGGGGGLRGHSASRLCRRLGSREPNASPGCPGSAGLPPRPRVSAGWSPGLHRARQAPAPAPPEPPQPACPGALLSCTGGLDPGSTAEPHAALSRSEAGSGQVTEAGLPPAISSVLPAQLLGRQAGPLRPTRTASGHGLVTPGCVSSVALTAGGQCQLWASGSLLGCPVPAKATQGAGHGSSLCVPCSPSPVTPGPDPHARPRPAGHLTGQRTQGLPQAQPFPGPHPGTTPTPDPCARVDTDGLGHCMSPASPPQRVGTNLLVGGLSRCVYASMTQLLPVARAGLSCH